ncbi:MAG TPA: DNA repair protein RecN, partial [bacterium]|nr:DNA repair protein RecN [bacterium]
IYVQKETEEKGVNIKLKVLEEDERIMEISRMLTGQIMGSTIINARELINYARKIKEGMSA